MKPYIVIRMLMSLDGRIELANWTTSADGTVENWQELYLLSVEGFDSDCITGRSHLMK